MSRPRIVMDTNVWLSALKSDQGASFRLFSLIGSEYFELCISDPLLFEYEDVALRFSDEIGLSHQDIRSAIRYIVGVSHHQYVYYRWPDVIPDPKDNHVLN